MISHLCKRHGLVFFSGGCYLRRRAYSGALPISYFVTIQVL